ncbi:CBS domain-containing protein [Halovenus sp. WSH3]|uniref:CBS domain-containing protein n=1 Tax=Halovenus carboxidivorans TaxID=2692199 RepID=A0A6B0TBZ1_9EURY|nr:CBS domain-containing protein [Halovenus carboxidivorans]MXR53163.1 CBS domain-containing protein [Halovenus carboxidivorans]
MFRPITVEEIMQTPVETIDSDESVRTAADRLAASGIGSLVVCEGAEPVGILTDTDITALVSAGVDPDTTTARERMSSPVITTEPTASIRDAAALIRDHSIKRLPVVEGEEIIGIVTTTDLSNYVPHLRHAARDRQSTTEGRRRDVRADTAYENDDWVYEYVGDEGQIDVGDELSFSKTLTEEDVRSFAEASGDTNRLHLDAEFAAQTRFGEQIAHGTLVAGVISAALARLPGLTIYLSQELSFLGPVRLGDRITAECAVVERLGENRFRLTTNVRDEAGELVIDGEATVISDPLPE